jgi:hypothetical protein
MAGFISEMFTDPSKRVEHEAMRIFTTNSMHNYKAAVVLFHDQEETYLSYRAIAADPGLNEYFDFANFRNPPEHLLESF